MNFDILLGVCVKHLCFATAVGNTLERLACCFVVSSISGMSIRYIIVVSEMKAKCVEFG